MKKLVIMFLILISISGCESLFSNVYGWDLTACYNHFSVCWELYNDNKERFPNPTEWLNSNDN